MKETTKRTTLSATTAVPSIPNQSTLSRLARLQAMDVKDLKAHWRSLFATEPPACSRRYLESRLAYRIQELEFSGLKAETRARLVAIGNEIDGGNIVLRRIRADSRPLPGTLLIRKHGGVQHIVTVLADGFEYAGRPYRSLSAIARYITGTRWNGWIFFGLRTSSGK